MRSHSHPMNTRASTVIATEAITELPICCLVRCSSSRTTGISGAIPNHPKKHRKNASHDMWNARIGALVKSLSRIRVALRSVFIGDSLKAIQHLQIAELSVLALRIDLLHGGQALRVSDVSREREFPVQPIFHIGVIEIAERPPARSGAAGIAEGPGLKDSAAAVPEIVGAR